MALMTALNFRLFRLVKNIRKALTSKPMTSVGSGCTIASGERVVGIRTTIHNSRETGNSPQPKWMLV